jgi:DNA-3-methyladenine glycosylase I
MSSYCVFWRIQLEDSLHRIYHDTQYGFPLDDDNALFGRLIFEINQAGLSWNTILRKADNFHVSYDDFAVDKVANYSEQDYNAYWNSSVIMVRLKIGSIHIKDYQKQNGQSCLRKPSSSLSVKSSMNF